LKIFYANARGIRSKIHSLKSILTDLHEINIVALAETNLSGNSKIVIPGYKWIGSNRRNKEGGGVGFLVKNSLLGNTTISKMPCNSTECLWLKITLSLNQVLCIGIFYGKQENDKASTVFDDYELLKQDILAFKAAGYQVLLTGDFNAKITSKYENHTSRNGKFLLDLVDKCNLDILNQSVKCQGVFTRVNTKNKAQKSIIDYAICTESLTTHFTSMYIDTDEIYKLTGKKSASDHNSIILDFKIQPREIPPIQNKPYFKINENTNWAPFKESLDVTKFTETYLAVNHKDMSDLYQQWLNKINQVCEKTLPKSNPTYKDPVMSFPEVKVAKNAKRESKKHFESSIATKNKTISQMLKIVI